jgi:hypothetical protein
MAVLKFQGRRGSAVEWLAANPILKDGEPGIETNTRKFKIGDGQTFWNDLPYYITQDAMQIIVAEMIANANPISDEQLDTIATAVQDRLTLPDLVLAYQNAKA